MMLFPRMRLSHLVATLALPAVLAGCAEQKQPTQFTPLTYDYLGQMHLNVATLDVVDNSVTNPEPGDIGYKSPSPPDHALRQMAADRLIATGNATAASTAHFVIDRAFILHQPGGTLDGQMNIHLDILNPEGQRVASASAQATQTLHPDPSQDVESPANLYEITKDMMQTINVEFEYQVRNSLNKWLVDAGGTPMNNAIQTQSLTDTPPVAGAAAETNSLTGTPSTVDTSNTSAPASTSTATAPTSSSTDAASTSTAPAATQDSEPNAIFPAGTDDASTQTTPKTLSPKPGFLKLPTTTKAQ
ncbi:hypothetical protein ACQ5TV_02635 [Acetobacter ghanensis]|uniref:hypothetical protein n=1 Tax=Acetobacter ghanensis TaxID=431306 RepID=UPI003D32F886